jgi:hypothetical protein
MSAGSGGLAAQLKSLDGEAGDVANGEIQEKE